MIVAVQSGMVDFWVADMCKLSYTFKELRKQTSSTAMSSTNLAIDRDKYPTGLSGVCATTAFRARGDCGLIAPIESNRWTQVSETGRDAGERERLQSQKAIRGFRPGRFGGARRTNRIVDTARLSLCSNYLPACLRRWIRQRSRRFVGSSAAMAKGS